MVFGKEYRQHIHPSSVHKDGIIWKSIFFESKGPRFLDCTHSRPKYSRNLSILFGKPLIATRRRSNILYHLSFRRYWAWQMTWRYYSAFHNHPHRDQWGWLWIPKQPHHWPVFLPCNAEYAILNLRLADIAHPLNIFNFSAQIANVSVIVFFFNPVKLHNIDSLWVCNCCTGTSRLCCRSCAGD